MSKFLRIETIRTLATSLAAVMLIGTIWSLTQEIEDQRDSTECRFDLSADVNRVKDDIDVALARIVEASVLRQEPNTPPEEVERLTALIPEQAVKIREWVRELEPLSERRDNGVALCS